MTCPTRAAVVFVAAAAVLAPLPAAAQSRGPTVFCSTRDYNMALDLELPLRGDGSMAVATEGLSGNLDINHQKVPPHRRRWSLDKRQPAQFWLAGNELKLRVVLGAGEPAATLVVETQRRSSVETDYTGSFRLETMEGVRVTGRLSCSTG
jgi:hypothetical protein